MIFSALINNITLIIALSILYSFIIRRWKYGSRTGKAISGFLFGAVAVVGILNPLIISPGLIFDGRSIIISIAGFIGGWVTALIAALMGIIYRTWLGGSGAIMGISVIASSAAIGIAYPKLEIRPRIYEVRSKGGAFRTILFRPVTLPTGKQLIIYEDITERKQAEQEQRQMNTLLDSVIENIPDMIFLKDAANLRFVRLNRAGEDLLGYSRNLKEEEICLEARILAVADVMEAMASHRPYRPGLGIDAALNEIEQNSGIFYDNAVATACLRLFREKSFKLEVT